MTQVEPDAKSGVKSETMPDTKLEIKSEIKSETKDMKSDTKTARNVPSGRSFTPEELQALTSSSLTAEEVEAMQAQLDKCHAADGTSKLTRPLKQLLTYSIAARAAAQEAAFLKANPVPGTPEAMELRYAQLEPARENYVRIMKLMCKWKGADIGPEPVEMLEQAAKILTVYKRADAAVLDEILLQLQRDIGLGKQLKLEKAEWEKARFTEMSIAHGDMLNATKMDDPKVEDEKS